jgi:hypothetical protein
MHHASRISPALLRVCVLLVRVATPFSAIAAEEIPPLAPPLPEIAPTFWEQHQMHVLLGAGAGLLLLALMLRLALRRKPTPPVPPEARVRTELQALRRQPETGEVLSRVSQSLRRYLVAAFALPPEELTTTEFCGRLNEHSAIGPELAAAVSAFLRECDKRKFSPAPPAAPLQAAARALELVELAEARRRQNQPTGETPAPPP